MECTYRSTDKYVTDVCECSLRKILTVCRLPMRAFCDVRGPGSTVPHARLCVFALARVRELISGVTTSI